MYKIGDLKNPEFVNKHAQRLGAALGQQLTAAYVDYGIYNVSRSEQPGNPAAGYLVSFDIATDDLTGERYKYADCNCPDSQHRGNWCKHTALVLEHHLANAKLQARRRAVVARMTAVAPDLVEEFLHAFADALEFTQRPVVSASVAAEYAAAAQVSNDIPQPQVDLFNAAVTPTDGPLADLYSRQVKRS